MLNNVKTRLYSVKTKLEVGNLTVFLAVMAIYSLLYLTVTWWSASGVQYNIVRPYMNTFVYM